MGGINIKDYQVKKNHVSNPEPEKETGSWFDFLNKDIALFGAKLNDKKKERFYSELTIGQAHGTGGFLGGAKYLPSTINSSELLGWVKGYADKTSWRLRKATFFACYSADLTLISLNYPTWPAACGIRPDFIQNNSYMYKNCGIFFGDVIRGGYKDPDLGGVKTTAEIAAIVDRTFVCGQYQYPGGCDPTYSWKFACQSTVNRFENFSKTIPSRAGFDDCIYTSAYDVELRNLDTSHVKLR